jgi:hypothetical protein
MPKPRFRIVNGPAKLLFIWPALDLLAYATLQPVMPLHGAALAVGTVFSAAVCEDRAIGPMSMGALTPVSARRPRRRARACGLVPSGARPYPGP